MDATPPAPQLAAAAELFTAGRQRRSGCLCPTGQREELRSAAAPRSFSLPAHFNRDCSGWGGAGPPHPLQHGVQLRPEMGACAARGRAALSSTGREGDIWGWESNFSSVAEAIPFGISSQFFLCSVVVGWLVGFGFVGVFLLFLFSSPSSPALPSLISSFFPGVLRRPPLFPCSTPRVLRGEAGGGAHPPRASGAAALLWGG